MLSELQAVLDELAEAYNDSDHLSVQANMEEAYWNGKSDGIRYAINKLESLKRKLETNNENIFSPNVEPPKEGCRFSFCPQPSFCEEECCHQI